MVSLTEGNEAQLRSPTYPPKSRQRLGFAKDPERVSLEGLSLQANDRPMWNPKPRTVTSKRREPTHCAGAAPTAPVITFRTLGPSWISTWAFTASGVL